MYFFDSKYQIDMKNSTLKRITAFACMAAVAVPAAISCKVDNTPHYSTYMTAVRETSDGKPGEVTHLVTDDSIKVFPANDLQSISSLENNSRIFATFTIPSGEITDPLYAEFSTVSQIRQDTIAHTSATSGKGDPIFINAAWKSGGIYGADKFLTLSFTFRGAGYTPHKFELSDEENAISNPDPMGYYLLTFKHDNSNEPDAYPYNGVITYPLTAKYTDGIKGLKIRFSTSSSPSAKDSTITVKY